MHSIGQIDKIAAFVPSGIQARPSLALTLSHILMFICTKLDNLGVLRMTTKP